MTINDIQDKIIEEMSLLNDWMDKYEYLIGLGNDLVPMGEAFKTDENLISGCQSKVWLSISENNGKLDFSAESDTLLIKGIIALLIRVLNNQKAEDVATSDLYFIDRTGLSSGLSPARANGITSIINRIRQYAKSSVNKYPAN